MTSLAEIEQLVNLKILGLSHNQLTSLAGIEKLVNLQILVLRHNPLTDETLSFLDSTFRDRATVVNTNIAASHKRKAAVVFGEDHEKKSSQTPQSLSESAPPPING